MAKVNHVGLTPTAPGVSESKRWSLPVHVDWREWDGEYVVRSQSSGATYLLSALAGEILRALHSGAASVDEVAARVLINVVPPHAATEALAVQFAGGRADTPSIYAVLAELESLGLAQAEQA